MSAAGRQAARQPLAGRAARWGRQLAWPAASIAAGLLVGALLEVGVVLAGGRFDPWLVQQSVLFGAAVGVAAQAGRRFVVSSSSRIPVPIRYGILLLAVIGGVLAAAMSSIALRPAVLWTAQRWPFVALVGLNTVLAVSAVGGLVAWDALRRALARALDEVRAKEAIEREIALARDVQLHLLPDRGPAVAGYEFAFTCRPARTVGGDFLDFLELPGGRVGVAIGDVVGKGIAAALQMANLQALVRALAPREGEPASLNAALSSAVAAASDTGRFVTFAYAVLEPASGEVHYSLAGHHPILIAGPDGVRALERGGLPLGVLPEAAYDQGRDRIASGERLVMYTDGVVEAPAPDGGEPFGAERLRQALSACGGESAEATVRRVLAALESYAGGGPAADDTTLLVVRRLEEAG
ncbi:MAG: hypothetical protein D6718_10565 [Acidobacteria bacterium]|nr:MAG: hypothetical protein D6718_10565 [Acidobacteriota bacterium]